MDTNYSPSQFPLSLEKFERLFIRTYVQKTMHPSTSKGLDTSDLVKINSFVSQGCSTIVARQTETDIESTQEAPTGEQANALTLPELTPEQSSTTTATSETTPIATPDPVSMAPGEMEFAAHCAGCHEPADKSRSTRQQIRWAINSNTGNMGSLSFLTFTQLDDIAMYLSTQ